MPHVIIFDAAAGIIRTKVEGNLDLNEMERLTSNLLRAAQRNKCYRFLTDYRAANLNLTVEELYMIPDVISGFAHLYSIPSHNFKRAMVADKSWNQFSFYEQISVEKQQKAKLFHSQAEAEAWLLQD